MWPTGSPEQAAFADAVHAWAAGRDYGDADTELGMKAAGSVLRQNGAGWHQIAEWNLDAAAVARAVLAGDPAPLKDLSAEARNVCTFAVQRFYERLLDDSGLRRLDGASFMELLKRADDMQKWAANTEKALAELREQLDRLLSHAWQETRAERERNLLNAVLDSIGSLESAQFHFRAATKPGASTDDSALHDARMTLVTARVGLEARAEQLIDPDLRQSMLAYVRQDEAQDQASGSASSDSETYARVRAETIDAYQRAQRAVTSATRRLEEAG